MLRKNVEKKEQNQLVNLYRGEGCGSSTMIGYCCGCSIGQRHTGGGCTIGANC